MTFCLNTKVAPALWGPLRGTIFGIKLSLKERVFVLGMGRFKSIRGRDSFIFEFLKGMTMTISHRTALMSSDDRVQFLEAILESAHDVIVTVDENGRIEGSNRAVAEMFGYQPQEIVGRRLGDLMFSPYREEHEARMLGHLTGAKAEVIGAGRRLVGVRKNGSVFPFSLKMSEIIYQDHRFFSAVIRDITNILNTEVKLEELTLELQRSNSELRQFAAVAAHDLQTPLRTIGNFASILSQRHKNQLTSDADNLLERITGCSQRMQSMISNLLALSQVGQKMKLEPVELNDIFDEIVEDFEMSIAEVQAIIRRDNLPCILADRGQVRQLLQNLLSNAIKFRHPNIPPQVHMGVEDGNGCWVLSVTDKGIGIEPKYFDRIFQLFQRLHSRNEYPGSGIGLSICKKIVEGHGGVIGVESESGKGSRFTFTSAKKAF